MAAGLYNGKKVSVIWAGTIYSNFSEDGVQITPNNEAASLDIGIAGRGALSVNNNHSARITLPLIASAPENDTLSQELEKFRAGTGGIHELLVRDQNGTSLYSAETAWIVVYPEASFGAQTGVREWVLETDKLKYFTGGINDV